MSKIKSSEQLVSLFQSLDDESKQTLSEFADFLLAKNGPVVKEIPAPHPIERPDKESVVGAVKRLKATYHMVESMTVFSAASALMTDHMVKGRDLVEVIDEMEALFEGAYKKLVDDIEEANK